MTTGVDVASSESRADPQAGKGQEGEEARDGMNGEWVWSCLQRVGDSGCRGGGERCLGRSAVCAG